MVPIEEMEEILNEIASEIPSELYNELNGGIILLPQVKLHTESRNNDLYILGEYTHGGYLGRYIAIYYGSFSRVYGYLSRDQLKERLKCTIKHEFTHHLESMAGERDLEIKDAHDIADYLNGK